MIPYYNRDYAWNKDADNAIVYRFDDGTRATVTLEDIVKNDPAMTIERALAIIRFSKADYEITDLQEHQEGNYTLSLSDTDGVQPSPETQMIQRIEQDESKQRTRLIRRCIDERLTEVQRRRLLLYMEGKSTRQIAALEGVKQNAVWQSISSAQKIISTFFAFSMVKAPVFWR